MTLIQFKEHYQDQLLTMKEVKEQEQKAFAHALREDEAKFAKIELNIIDIFDKMFAASVAKAPKNSESDWKEPLKAAYLGFFDKITAGWHEHLAKCEQFGKIEEAHIERLKITQANALRELFVKFIENEGGGQDD